MMLSPQFIEVMKSIATIMAAAAAISGMIVGLVNRRTLQETKSSINGRLDQLLKAAHNEGRIAERAEMAQALLADPHARASLVAKELVTKTVDETASAQVAAKP